MKDWLNKKKRWGHNDFIEKAVHFGTGHKEFLGYDLRENYFFVMFWDGKYREQDYKTEKKIEELKGMVERHLNITQKNINY